MAEETVDLQKKAKGIIRRETSNDRYGSAIAYRYADGYYVGDPIRRRLLADNARRYGDEVWDGR